MIVHAYVKLLTMNGRNILIPDACALTGGIVVYLNYTW